MKSEVGLLISNQESIGDSIQLLGVKVEGDIVGRGAKVRVLQRFKNQESKPVEAIYKFPLPEGAAICGFKAHVGDRVIEGKVEEREKAFEIYDKALIEGHGGYLLDQERPNIFTLSVGNLNQRSEVLVEIEYVTLLDGDSAAVRFFLPTTISPRYIPDGAKDDSGVPVDGRLHPPYAVDVPYGLSISLNIHGGRQIKSVESPSHNIKVENIKGDLVKASFSSGETNMDRDMVLTITYEEAFKTRAYHCRFENESYLQLDMMLDHGETHQRAPKDVPRDVLFVLDCIIASAASLIGNKKLELPGVITLVLAVGAAALFFCGIVVLFAEERLGFLHVRKRKGFKYTKPSKPLWHNRHPDSIRLR